MVAADQVMVAATAMEAFLLVARAMLLVVEVEAQVTLRSAAA